MGNRYWSEGVVVCLLGCLLSGEIARAGTLEEVRQRGVLRCGVEGSLSGFSMPDAEGKMQGIDADVCYAVAAAVLGSADNVVFIPLISTERFEALTAGEVDVLSRNTTHTLGRDSGLGVDFTYYNYIDGQGFMVRRSSGVRSALELDGQRICVKPGTTTERNLAAYFSANEMRYSAKEYASAAHSRRAFEKGDCEALSSDKSQLAAIRSELESPRSAIILPETISKEPLGPVVREGDSRWAEIVRGVLFAMITADELDVSAANVDEIAAQGGAGSVHIRVLLGLEGDTGERLGLDAEWAYRLIKQVGNYDESYQRHLAPLGLPREGTVNALWTKGGILYAPPF